MKKRQKLKAKDCKKLGSKLIISFKNGFTMSLALYLATLKKRGPGLFSINFFLEELNQNSVNGLEMKNYCALLQLNFSKTYSVFHLCTYFFGYDNCTRPPLS